jgi:hypothetical protein
VSLQQRRLLVWFLQGYDDTQVAAWLGTTPLAVRLGGIVLIALSERNCALPRGPLAPPMLPEVDMIFFAWGKHFAPPQASL